MKTSFNYKNIVLIGFMGSGKTEVGKRLAENLSWNFIDTDTIIEKAEKMSIADLFAKKGEPYFRDLETKTIATLQSYHNFVISCGGGMVLKKGNVADLKKIGPLVLLAVDSKTVVARLKGATNRPLINVANPEEKINEILTERIPIYNAAADFVIDTTNLSVDQVVHEILEELNG